MRLGCLVAAGFPLLPDNLAPSGFRGLLPRPQCTDGLLGLPVSCVRHSKEDADGLRDVPTRFVTRPARLGNSDSTPEHGLVQASPLAELADLFGRCELQVRQFAHDLFLLWLRFGIDAFIALACWVPTKLGNAIRLPKRIPIAIDQRSNFMRAGSNTPSGVRALFSRRKYQNRSSSRLRLPTTNTRP